MGYLKYKKVRDRRFGSDSLCFLLYLIIYNEISKNSYSLVLGILNVIETTDNSNPMLVY